MVALPNIEELRLKLEGIIADVNPVQPVMMIIIKN
jgi:hypothetical protein